MKSAGAISLAVLLAVAVSAAAQTTHTITDLGTLGGSSSQGTEAAPRSLSSLPAAAQGSISAVLGRDDSRYWFRATAGSFHAGNPEHDLAVDFIPQGVEVCSKTARWVLAVRSYGYGDALLAVSAAAPQAKTNRVEFRRGALTEWYNNGPLGLEQGLTLTKPPGQANGRPLTVELALSGDLMASLEPSGTALTLTRRDGQAALRYSGLMAYDAIGRELRTWLELRGKRLRLHVDDSRAQYPLVIDPFVQQAKLTASDGASGDGFGSSVAISGDTLVVGASTATVGSNSLQGAAYVFVRPVSGWTTTSTFDAKLTASDGAGVPGGDRFGTSVAISGDTVVIGSPQATIGSNIAQGAAYVFVKPGTAWVTTTETAKLTASNKYALGQSVGISGDTVVVSGRDAAIVSAAYVFIKPLSGWTTTSISDAKLTASVASADNGAPVAISGDTVVLGAYNENNGCTFGPEGAVYVFVKPGTGWVPNTETAKLTASDGACFYQLGLSVAISGDTIVAGAFATIGSHINQGAAYVFVKPTTGWATGTETAKLTASDGAANDLLGSSVAIADDTVVVGAKNATVGSNVLQGAVYVFVKPTTGWATGTETAKLTASDGATNDHFSVATVDAAGRVIVGLANAKIGSNFNQGAAYVFGASAAQSTTTTVSSNNNPSFSTPPGNSVTFTATVISSSVSVMEGTVTFMEGTTTLAGPTAVNGSGQATFTTSSLTTGTHNITAVYNGTANFLTSSGSVSQVVNDHTAQIMVGTSPAGRSFTVDGTTYTSAQTFTWTVGSSHTLATTSPQAGTAGTQYVFNNWSDAGAISHAVIAPSTAMTYTATFDTQYQLTTQASPSADGSVMPASGSFFAAGATIPVTATANAGFAFSNWTSTAGTFDSTVAASTNFHMPSAPATVTGNFAAAYKAYIQQPVNADGSSIFNASKGVVPAKFTLTQNGTTTCTLPAATIAVTRTAGGTLGAIDESVYSQSADSGSNFRIDSCQYVYNLNAKSFGVGTYRVDILIANSVVGSATFALK